MSEALEDLSDDELTARLVNHGCELELARGWVRLRDEEPTQRLLIEALQLEDDEC